MVLEASVLSKKLLGGFIEMRGVFQEIFREHRGVLTAFHGLSWTSGVSRGDSGVVWEYSSEFQEIQGFSGGLKVLQCLLGCI